MKGVNPEDIFDVLDQVNDVWTLTWHFLVVSITHGLSLILSLSHILFLSLSLSQDDVWEEIDSVIDADDDHSTSDMQFRYPLGNPIVLKINKIKK